MFVKFVIKSLQSGIYSDRWLFRESVKCTKIPYVIQKEVAEPWKILGLQLVYKEECVKKSRKFYIPYFGRKSTGREAHLISSESLLFIDAVACVQRWITWKWGSVVKRQSFQRKWLRLLLMSAHDITMWTEADELQFPTRTFGVKTLRYRQSSDPVTSTCLAKMLLWVHMGA